MRKVSDLPSMRLYRGVAARPVFLGERPRFVTRRDWSPVLWALAALGAAVAGFVGAAYLLLGGF